MQTVNPALGDDALGSRVELSHHVVAVRVVRLDLAGRHRLEELTGDMAGELEKSVPLLFQHIDPVVRERESNGIAERLLLAVGKTRKEHNAER